MTRSQAPAWQRNAPPALPADVAAEVRRQLDALPVEVPQGPVAIPVGSRGICQIPLESRTAGQWLREHGAEPFIVPAMCWHNGATADGQQEMIESFGMIEVARSGQIFRKTSK